MSGSHRDRPVGSLELGTEGSATGADQPIEAGALALGARQVLLANSREGRYTVPSATTYPAQWLWDAGFVALGWATFDLERAVVELETLVLGQGADGRLAHIVFFDDADGYFPGPGTWGTTSPSAQLAGVSGITQPPLLGMVLERLVSRAAPTSPLRRRLLRLFEHLEDNSEWWSEAREVPAGDGTVAAIVHPWESGMDNSPAFDGPLARVSTKALVAYQRHDTDAVPGEQRPRHADYDRYWALVLEGRSLNWDPERLRRSGSFFVADPLVNALLIASRRALARVGRQLGANEERCTSLERAADRVRVGLKALFDSHRGAFRALDLRTRALTGPPTASGLVCAVVEDLEPAQRQAIAHQAAAWRGTWGRGLPTVGPHARSFEPSRYWRGSVWLNTSWLVAEGLRTLAPTVAGDLRADCRRLVVEAGFREYFHPISGDGLGTRDFSWTAALSLWWLAEPRELVALSAR